MHLSGDSPDLDSIRRQMLADVAAERERRRGDQLTALRQERERREREREMKDKSACEDRLVDFIRYGWRWIEGQDFIPNWHIEEMAEYLQAVSNGEIRRLIINIPPRHMKSILVAVMWPAWTWINHPEVRWLFASYAHALSIRDNVKCRRVIQSPWYQRLWGDRFTMTSDQNTKIRFDNDKGGYRLATSVDGSLTGEGGDVIVIDDPHNVTEAESPAVRDSTLAWWDEAMSSRLNDPKTGAYVIIQQRVHENDLTGHILALEHGWEHLCLPARYEPDHPFVYALDKRSEPGELLWPQRFGETELNELEAKLGPYAAAGQLQQRPSPREGGMFARHWFEIVDAVPGDAKRVRYWDLAATDAKTGSDPDYTAGCRMALKDGIVYIEDMRRARVSSAKVEAMIQVTAQQDGTALPIYIEQEPGSSGKAIIDHYSRRVLLGHTVRGNRETGSKEMRAEPLSAAAETGNVKLVRGAWNEDFLREVELFPVASHDDQVDAASGAYRMLVAKQPHKQVRLAGF